MEEDLEKSWEVSEEDLERIEIPLGLGVISAAKVLQTIHDEKLPKVTKSSAKVRAHD